MGHETRVPPGKMEKYVRERDIGNNIVYLLTASSAQPLVPFLRLNLTSRKAEAPLFWSNSSKVKVAKEVSMRKARIVLAVFGWFAASPALAAVYAGTCTTAPEAQWMTEAAIKAKIAEAGYTVAKLKRTRTGNCYEAYVTDKDGKRMELFLDPTDAKIVHSQ